MNKLDKEYQMLLEDILSNGVEKKDRTGTGTISTFGRQIRHDMKDGFPLLTTKKMAWKTMARELLWFLSGSTNIKWLVDNKCNIWNGDAYRKYHQSFPEAEMMSKEQFIGCVKKHDAFAERWGELGPVYGKQWRGWRGIDTSEMRTTTYNIDQIANLIKELKTNPDSRRLMVSAWNVGELDQMTLPPCHYGFQIYTKELSPLEIIDQAREDGLWVDGSGFDGESTFGKNSNGQLFHEWVREHQSKFKTRSISLMWNQRSVDTFLGLPFNIASYGLLLTMLGKEVNMVPDQLIGNLGDVHIYKDHIDQAAEQINRESYPLPKLKLITNHNFRAAMAGKMDEIILDDFVLINYQAHPSIKAPLSN
jgi:thymidylate synthase